MDTRQGEIRCPRCPQRARGNPVQLLSAAARGEGYPRTILRSWRCVTCDLVFASAEGILSVPPTLSDEVS